MEQSLKSKSIEDKVMHIVPQQNQWSISSLSDETHKKYKNLDNSDIVLAIFRLLGKDILEINSKGQITLSAD